jgi:hypothetical protein
MWQLPQHIIALCIITLKHGVRITAPVKEQCWHIKGLPGSVSFGGYCLFKDTVPRAVTIAHEAGHSKQSRMLGPLYLPLVGIRSALRCVKSEKEQWPDSKYFGSWPENWADRLAGIKWVNGIRTTG